MNAADYVDAVVAGLDRLGVPVLDSWTQEDDECWEGLIELKDDDTEDAAPADAAVEDVVRLIAAATGHDPDQVTLF